MKSASASVLAVLSLALARPCFADVGTEPLDFLLLDANARPVALGGAYTALGTDANALLYNPAGLAKVDRSEATFMHNAYPQGVRQEYFAFAHPSGWGVNLNSLDFGDVPATTISNPAGTGLGNVTMTDLALGAGYGRPVTEWLSLGVGAKYVRENIAGSPTHAVAADAGLLCSFSGVPGLSAGFSAQNLGSRTGGDAHENLPLLLRWGGALRFDTLGHATTLSLDVTKERNQSPQAGAGGEFMVVPQFAVRLGYATRNEAGIGITAGFGILSRYGSIDYAFVPMGELGGAHRVSATLRWGPAGRTRPAPQPQS